MAEIEDILSQAGVKPTSNRILVMKEIKRCHSPQSLMDLETSLETLDKSSISRVLSLLLEKGVIHAVEDGRGITRYETCHNHHSGDNEPDSDMHVHFYCEHCRRVFCFEDIPAPSITIPDGYLATSVNYMIKGICPDCRK